MKIKTLTTTVSILLLGTGFALAQNGDCPRGGKGKGKCGEGRGDCETVCVDDAELLAKGNGQGGGGNGQGGGGNGQGGGGNGQGKRDRRRDGTGGGCDTLAIDTELLAKGQGGGGNGQGKRERRRDGTGDGCQKALV